MITDNKRVRKQLLLLTIITMIGVILGMLFISVVSSDNKELIKESINSYFNGIYDGKILYFKGFCNSLIVNSGVVFLIWIFGISIVGLFLSTIILFFKSFLVGFSYIGILYTYGLKGFFISIIYIIPEILYLFIIFLTTYYSISFSKILFNHIFKKKDYNRNLVVNRYIKIFIFSLILCIIYSIVSVFLVPIIIKIF